MCVCLLCVRGQNAQRASNDRKGNSHCSCTRSASLAGPVGPRCTRPRCVHAGHHVCRRSRPLGRRRWWCSPSAPPERGGSEPHWTSRGPRWSCSVEKRDKGEDGCEQPTGRKGAEDQGEKSDIIRAEVNVTDQKVKTNECTITEKDKEGSHVPYDFWWSHDQSNK